MGHSNGYRGFRWFQILILSTVLLLRDAVNAQVREICINPSNELICVVCGCKWNERQMMMFPFVTLHRCDCPAEIYEYPPYEDGPYPHP